MKERKERTKIRGTQKPVRVEAVTHACRTLPKMARILQCAKIERLDDQTKCPVHSIPN